jgi:sigma-B regulation protein RsbU (phosphoserine phosphatase)
MIQILVIDDDLAIRTFLSRALKRQGYEVHLAANGTEGLEMAIALKPNLIICDWMMPGMSGLEVCTQVKANPVLAASTFFVLLTALDSTENKVMGLDVGADDFLCKPIEIVELQARVRAVLRLQQLTEALHRQKQQLEDEFGEAAQYVQSILPPPLNRARLKIASHFIPSSQLGGDIFDYFWLDTHRIVIYLLDVSGHGLKAALPSIAVFNLLRSRNGYQGVDHGSPQDVLAYLNANCKFIEQQEQYFTMWYGVYDIEERILTYGSAGHPPAVLIKGMSGRMPSHELLRTKGLPIGLFPPEEATYRETQQYIPFDSQLYIFSDGVYENTQATSSQDNWDANSNLKCNT